MAPSVKSFAVPKRNLSVDCGFNSVALLASSAGSPRIAFIIGTYLTGKFSSEVTFCSISTSGGSKSDSRSAIVVTPTFLAMVA